MPVPRPARACAAALVVLATVLLGLAVDAGPAQARSCTTDGSVRVCLAIQRDSCSPDRPYRCRSARDEQHYRNGRFDYAQYEARRRTCAGFGGTDCRLEYKTFCTTTRSSKRCRTDSGTTCKGGRVSKCIRTIDTCLTRRGYSCRFTTVEERCRARSCRTTRTICNTRNGRKKRCYARFSKGPGRGREDAAKDEEDANLPFFEDDGSVPEPGADDADASACEATSPPEDGSTTTTPPC